MWELINGLKEWLMGLDYESIGLPAPAEKNVALGKVDLTRYESPLVVSIIPETEENSDQYDYNNGQALQLNVTVTYICRGAEKEKLIENMSKYSELVCDSINKECTLGGIVSGSGLGQRTFFTDAGTVEAQLTAVEIALTLLYIKEF